VKIVWHDHYGNAEYLEERDTRFLVPASRFFDAVCSVNERLETWARERLRLPAERILYLENFASFSPGKTPPDLPGDPEHRIVCLANLRAQKDHPNLIDAFGLLHRADPRWHLLLVWEDRGDDYSRSLKESIRRKGLEDHIHLLGSRSDTAEILSASTIGVLSSRSEGLPVALLEYGLSGLPVVCTDVGQCAEVVGEGEYGLIVPPGNPAAMAQALKSLMETPERRRKLGEALRRQVETRYSEKAVVKRLLELYREVLT
jgi:glycosyltransferase involved in cell wall biosynthesis